ncbi:MAG: hypothetical protein R3Y07_04105 [Eubacteriales bacterium]
MSTNYTPNYDLCQWEPEDQVNRLEFNEDNLKTEQALNSLVAQIATLSSQIQETNAYIQQVESTVFSSNNLPFVVGSYTGNGATSITVNLGFKPSLVMLNLGGGTYHYGYYFCGAFGNQNFTAYGVNTANVKQIALSVSSSGFTAYHYNTNSSPYLNQKDAPYHYIAFR